jgi:hypothetical protein
MNPYALPLRMNRSVWMVVCFGFLAVPCLHAEDALSVPVVEAPTATGQSVTLPAPIESEKAPSAVKPSAKPQFTLPEVVITGDNQLTIGAKRLDRHEDDVTRGSQELRGLSRSENDLPGLENQRTGLSALSPEAARDTVAILHGGVGTEKTWEGWGLLGTQMKGFRALLEAMGDQWGGVSLGTGKNRKRMAGWGGVLQAEPTEDLQLRFSRDYRGIRNDLPYQGGIENRMTSATEGDAVFRFAPAWKAEAQAYYWDTHLEAGSLEPDAVQTIEREGRVRIEWAPPGGLFENLWLEAGGRLSNGHFSPPALTRLDAAWGKTGLRMALQSKIFLDLSMGATRLGGVVSKMKGEPKAELELLPGDATRVLLHVRSARTLPLFQETQGVAAYTVPTIGFFASPGFIRGRGGRRCGPSGWWNASSLSVGSPRLGRGSSIRNGPNRRWPSAARSGKPLALLRCWEGPGRA